MSQKRYAYLIGANGPEGMRLKHAERDVTRLADALKGSYCQFTSAEFVIAHRREDALGSFEDFIEQCDPSDLLLVHFSGHATFDQRAASDKQLYLLCNNTDLKRLVTTALEIDDIKKILRRGRPRQKVLILDCCHAAGAHDSALGALKGEQDIQGMLHETMRGSATVILSACSREKRTREVDELDGGSGFLSWAIRAGCTTNFHEASSAPDPNVLSLDDLWRRWIPKALEYVNSLPSVSKPLPPPILLSELESGYGSEIWLTDPPSSVRNIRTSSDEMHRKYLEQVYKRYSSVALPIGPPEGFSLQAIFQPLALRRDPLAPGDLERKQRRMFLDEAHGDDDEYPYASSAPLRKERSGAADQPAPLVIAENGEAALAKSPQGRMVVLGGPGTGKTTTLKYLISCRAKDALANSMLPVPIFLSLADLARKTLQSCLIDVVEDMSVERSYADALWKAIESGHAFVALDGLDEVDPAQRTRMIELVNRRASEPGNTWLIGSRFTEYKGGQFKRGQFAEWELLPMSPQLRQDLAAKLFPELQCLLSLPSMSSLSPSTFVSLLENHPHAAAWGENPLLFSLAAVVFVETGGLPPSRATLYHDVIEAVLAMREQDTDGRTHLLRTLTGLALWLYKRRTGTFTNDDLFTFLEDIQHRSWEEAEKIAKRIIASGVLDLIAPNTYGFRHPTFQEYLAAVELAKWLTSHDPATRKEAWKFVWDRHIYSRWTEVLRLMVGVLAQLPGKKGRSTAVRWLHQLVEQRSTEEGDPGDLGLELALKSLVEVTEVAEWETVKTAQLEKHVVSIWIDELLEVARNQRQTRVERFNSLVKDVVYLRECGREAVVGRWLRALKDRDEDVRDIAREMLEVLGTWIPLDRLLAMLEDPDRFVRRAAVQVVGQQGERVPLDRLLAMLEDPDEDVRQAAVQVIGQQGERVSIDALLPFFYDKDADIRRAALEVLETLSERVPLEPLIELLSDEDGNVREIAVRILKKVAPDVLSDLLPQAMSVLQGKVVGNVFASLVQISVAETIGNMGLTSTPLLEKLTELLDWPHWQVRRKAIQALGQLHRNIPDVVIRRLLQLRRDPDPKMRAVQEAADDALAEILSLETGIEDE